MVHSLNCHIWIMDSKMYTVYNFFFFVFLFSVIYVTSFNRSHDRFTTQNTIALICIIIMLQCINSIKGIVTFIVILCLESIDEILSRV